MRLLLCMWPSGSEKKWLWILARKLRLRLRVEPKTEFSAEPKPKTKSKSEPYYSMKLPLRSRQNIPITTTFFGGKRSRTPKNTGMNEHAIKLKEGK